MFELLLILLLYYFILFQIFEEVENAKEQYGKLNTIVMNAVLEACVHCGDVDSALRVFDEMSKPESCGVDEISYATLLKVLTFFSSFFRVWNISEHFMIGFLLYEGIGWCSKN